MNVGAGIRTKGTQESKWLAQPLAHEGLLSFTTLLEHWDFCREVERDDCVELVLDLVEARDENERQYILEAIDVLLVDVESLALNVEEILQHLFRVFVGYRAHTAGLAEYELYLAVSNGR